MLRRDAIGCILDCCQPDTLVVIANGYASREAFAHRDRDLNFYMIGSMGLASSIGLGVALSRSKQKVVVIEGDGNLLMGFSVFPMAGAWRPKAFLHIVVDNQTYGSTGSQPTISQGVDFGGTALCCGYDAAAKVTEAGDIRRVFEEWQKKLTLYLLHIEVDSNEPPVPPRVAHSPHQNTLRIQTALQNLK